MFSLPRLLLVALLAAPAALAAGTPSPVPVAPTRIRRYAPVEDASSVFNPTGVAARALAHNPVDARGLTNGQRLARGLPPRSPAFNTRRRALAPRQSATPCALSQATGTIRVADANGAVLGYVSASANTFGEYSLATDAAAALSVVLRRCDSNDSPFDIETLVRPLFCHALKYRLSIAVHQNGVSAYPYLGGVVGFANTDDNLRSGSFNYVYIAGTSQGPYHATLPLHAR